MGVALTPEAIKAYIDLGLTAFNLGEQAYGFFKVLLKAHEVSDDQINEIEAGIISDAEKRKAERQEMARSGGDIVDETKGE